MKRVGLPVLLLLAVVAVPLAARADESGKPSTLTATVTTAEGEQAAGPIASVADGALTLGTEPPRTLQLADLERIQFGNVPVAAATGELVWIGQDNHDLVQVGGAAGGNGIQDVHLHVDRLAQKPVKQITVVCRFPKLLRVWRLDTSQSPHWRAAIVRSDLAPQAELYLEPPADDSFGMKFDLTITYNDGLSSKASVAATTHTSDTAKINRSAQPGETSPAKAASDARAAGTAEIYLADQGLLRGDVVSLSPESLVLRASWDAEVEVPILHVRGIWFGKEAPTGSRADFDKQLTAPVADDVAFVAAPDKTGAQLAGGARSLNAEKFVLRFDGDDRTINRDRLLGLVFAAHPKIPGIKGPYQGFLLASGQSITGQWVGVSDKALEIETPWHTRWSVPGDTVSEIRIRNGKLVYLSDLEPLSVEETAYFGRVVPWSRDQRFDGAAPAMKGKKPVRSLAMHSRCVLVYPLDEQFEMFKATVGFDDSSQDRGRVACRVLADGRELFAQDDLRADRDPLPVEVSVGGAKQLTLEVDFGQDADVGDRVLWAEPRLFRAEKQ